MPDNLHRHDVWGDDPEERDASAVVREILAQPGMARKWHDHPSIIWVKAVARFIGRNGKRIAVTIAGFTVLLVGVALLVLPGPGWLMIFVGLGILSSEYLWARRLLSIAKRKAEQAKDAVMVRKNNRAQRKAQRNDGVAQSPFDDVA
ncbi:MAG: PGPGW domain-containing protein [Actinomycetota bacterium]|nr:PGPGW domain-containing protein [Actinomycetota bacterium]MDH5224582.1 PGPGW domain-containing protein [Actinomycetota bacterium]MDH5314375.1 PGPGW domain-containing protein [Actinomycetota bacterium]